MKDFFQRMARYNTWMNDKLYTVCDTIPDEVRKDDLGAFFKSIHGTFNHLLLADRIWLGRFLGQPFPATSLDQELYGDFSQLWSERKQTDAEIEAWAAALTEEQLQSPLRFTTMSSPTEIVIPLWQVAQHLFNHQTHHRGQITTLMNQLGFDSGVTDILRLP